MFREVKIFCDLWEEGGRGMGQGRAAKSGNDFFGNCPAANKCAPFEHEGFQSRSREITRRDQPVMAAANNDDVVSCHPRFLSKPKRKFGRGLTRTHADR